MTIGREHGPAVAIATIDTIYTLIWHIGIVTLRGKCTPYARVASS